MTAIALDGPHWRFALRFYGLPGVSDACLLLQDRLGVDVNILLLSAYAAAEHGIGLDAHDVGDMDAIVAPWRSEVIAELRKLRRRLKSGPEPAPCDLTEQLRAEIKRAELHAEQVQQAVLAGWLERHPFTRPRSLVDISHALHAVVAYFANVHGASVDAADPGELRNAMQTLLAAAARLRSGGMEPASSAASRRTD
jgi:uncharacterized protein (TIGR02444 family)